MKIALALCVLLMGTLAHSEVILTSNEAKQIIAKLDSLTYLRAGNVMLDSMVQSLKAQTALQDSIIGTKDKLQAVAVARMSEMDRRYREADATRARWKTAAIAGCSASVVLAAVCVLIGGR